MAFPDYFFSIVAKDYHNDVLVVTIVLVFLIIGHLSYLSIRPRPNISAVPSSSLSDADTTKKARKSRRARRATEKAAATKARLAGSSSSRTNEPSSPTVIPAAQPKVKQPYDAFLVLDVEGTCVAGSGIDWPNEIIEWPVCLLLWKSVDGSSQLEIVDEYRTFVKPTWRPQLTDFCTNLTGITQAQINLAPPFSEVVDSFAQFLIKHGLIDSSTGKRLVKFCWCCDGPYDIRDFVTKQCFFSKITTPDWLKGDIIDVRSMVSSFLRQMPKSKQSNIPIKKSQLKIPVQLSALGLPPFEGRAHSGIDDARNIARILTELARKGVYLVPNARVTPGRRFPWMGESGEVIEEKCTTFRNVT